MNPAERIIQLLGGEAQVAFLTGTSYTAPYRWQAARRKGGTGGMIPQRHHRALLDYARDKGIALTAEEFLPLPGPAEPAGAAQQPQALQRGQMQSGERTPMQSRGRT